MNDRRDPECVAVWPECHDFGYDPRCCRFPKSCSAGPALQLPPNAQIASLTVEIAQLRKDLREQWEANHAEHCSNEWPHPEGRVCYWQPPASLAGSA